ncbi:hypothetical protein HDU76_010508, partial [Blyttiomyces sp. JEL0837]
MSTVSTKPLSTTQELIEAAHRHVNFHLPLPPPDDIAKVGDSETVCRLILKRIDADSLHKLACLILKAFRGFGGQSPVTSTDSSPYYSRCSSPEFEKPSLQGKPETTDGAEHENDQPITTKSVREQNSISIEDGTVKYVAKDIETLSGHEGHRFVRANGGGDFSADDDSLDIVRQTFDNKELLLRKTHESALDLRCVKIRAAVTRIFHARGRAKHHVNEEGVIMIMMMILMCP